MSSEVEIRAPAEQTEGTRSQILRWLKSVGESVTENEPLIELETDKVTVEVASPGSGTLREILKHEQDEIAPGDLLGLIEVAGAETAAGETAGLAGNGTSQAANIDSSQVHRRATNGTATRGDGQAAHGADRATSPPAQSVSAAPTPAATAAMEGASDAGIPGHAAQHLSPAVRRLLAERNLDPSAVRGTGQGGRITVADVLAHGAHRGQDQAPSVSAGVGFSSPVDGVGGARNASGAPPVADTAVHTTMPPATANVSSEMHAPSVPVAQAPANPASEMHAPSAPVPQARASVAGGGHRVPHTATRKRIADHMVQSLLHTAPHVTSVFEADMTAVLNHRQRHKEDFARRGAPLTLTAYFLQAAVAGIRVVPEVNSRWTDSALEVFDSMHIGVATALEAGLVVPVLRDVQTLDLFGIAQGLDGLVTRARDGDLAPADVRGGTFTISNHGVSGSLVATPIIINQPQSAILGVGKLEKRPVVITSDDGEDQIVIRPRCYVTLTIDHRVMDGHQANRFLQTFVERLAKPE